MRNHMSCMHSLLTDFPMSCKTCPSPLSISKCLHLTSFPLLSLPPPPSFRHRHLLPHSTITPHLLALRKSQKRTLYKPSAPAYLAMNQTQAIRTLLTSPKFLLLRRKNVNLVSPSCWNLKLLPPLLL